MPHHPILRALIFCTAAALVCVGLNVSGATPRPQAQPAQPALSDEDLDAIQALLTKMSEAFMHGDAQAMKALLAESPERDTIVDTLKREFEEATYVDVQVERPTPDDTISETRQSVEAIIRVKVLYLDDARSPDARKPVENTTFKYFIVQRDPNGSFRIVNSSFFDNMGRHRGGMRLFVHVLAAVIVFCAALAFWVWMASEAWWIRPRSTLWRVAMMLPPLGPLVFFLFRYLPGKLRRSKS